MGLEIEALCPVCKTGRLQPVYELPQPPMPTVVIHGPVGSKLEGSPRIDRLSCPHCFISAEANDRGKNIVQALGPKTEGFTNPPRELEKCGCHRIELSVGGYVPQALRHELDFDPDEPGRNVAAVYARRFKFCTVSGRIFWVIPALLEQAP